jgi:hypothetical protein
MTQIVNFKLKNSIERLTHVDHFNFYIDDVVEPIEDYLPEIFIIRRIYNLLKSLLEREDYYISRRGRNVRDVRYHVDKAFDTFIMAVNSAYIVNETGTCDPVKRRALSRIIHTINAATIRLNFGQGRKRVVYSGK